MTTAANADRTWMDDVNCKGADTDIFYEDSRREEAVAICGMCPVRRQCHDYAIRTKEVYGVWGGDTSRLRNTHRHHPKQKNQYSGNPNATDIITDCLQRAAPAWVTPHAIAERTGLQANTVQKALRRAVDRGAPIEHTDGGWYRVKKEVRV
jgi:hypothetical protein